MWGARKSDSFSFEVGRGSNRPARGSFREDLLDALSQDLGSSDLPSAAPQGGPDFYFRLPNSDQLAVVEVSIGDPDLPLPSSTPSRIRLLKESMRQQSGGVSPTPIVVTNYKIHPDQVQELAIQGIRLVNVPPNAQVSKIVDEIKSAAASAEKKKKP